MNRKKQTQNKAIEKYAKKKQILIEEAVFMFKELNQVKKRKFITKYSQ